MKINVLTHSGGVRHCVVTSKRLPLLVENGGLGVTLNLVALPCALIEALLGRVRVIVHHCILVTGQERLLERFCVDQGWAKV